MTVVAATPFVPSVQYLVPHDRRHVKERGDEANGVVDISIRRVPALWRDPDNGLDGALDVIGNAC